MNVDFFSLQSYIMYLEHYIFLIISQLQLYCLYLELGLIVHSHVWTSISCTDFETMSTMGLFETLGRAESGLELAALRYGT